MTDLTIVKQEIDARRGRYVARAAGLDAEAEITFTHRGPGVISADHTGVPDAMAGRGVGMAMIAFMLDDARREGFKIVPICPYVRAQYAKHPEWAELFTTKPGENPPPHR